MKFQTLSLVVGLAAITTSTAFRIPFKQFRRPTLERRAVGQRPSDFQLSVLAATEDNTLDLNSVHDMIYTSDIVVAGTNYTVQFDTGSSDLWIKGSSFPLPNATHTSLTRNLTYGIGWAYGNVSYAPVEFADFSIPSQGFVDVSSANNPSLGYGANGIVGLGFTSLSQVDFAVNKSGSTAGRSLLYNIFAINPKEPNFLAFSLQRSVEPEADDVEGVFSIGEYEPKYAAIENQTVIPTWPVNSPNRWDVLLDALIVNHLDNRIVVPTTVVVGAPSNKAVVNLDNGSSYSYAPKAMCEAMYGTIPGAYLDNATNIWVIPCDYEIDMALQIGGQVFPIHPLDATLSGRTNKNLCIGPFFPQNVSVGAGQFDWLLGDNFLRSVYSIYDFGDFDESGNMGNPYVKLLSLVNPDEGSVDFHNARGGQANTNITYEGLNGAAAMPSFNISQDVSSTLEKISRYLPAMLAVVALNALILIILTIAGTIIYCRRRRPSATARSTRGRLSPMPLNLRHSYVAGSGLPPPDQPHVYEPVSMALTDDTFVPPSPAFHSFEGSRLRPGDRPKSIA